MRAKAEQRKRKQAGGQPRLPLAVRRAISDRLRMFMRRECLLTSQAQLAEKIGVSPQTVSNWFGSNPAVPGAAHLLLMARPSGLRVRLNPGWLLTGEGAEGLGAPISEREAKAALWSYVRAHAIADLVSAGGITEERAAQIADLFLTDQRENQFRAPVHALYLGALYSWLEGLAKTSRPIEHQQFVAALREALYGPLAHLRPPALQGDTEAEA